METPPGVPSRRPRGARPDTSSRRQELGKADSVETGRLQSPTHSQITEPGSDPPLPDAGGHVLALMEVEPAPPLAGAAAAPDAGKRRRQDGDSWS